MIDLKPTDKLPTFCMAVESTPGEDNMWIPTPAPCCICGEPTCWLELNFEAFVCAGVCQELAWQRYWEANRVAGTLDMDPKLD